MNWTRNDIPSQEGRLIVVTGATGGLGFETASALAAAGAEVVLTGRNAGKGANALARIKAETPQANIRYADLDLADLSSVERFAGSFLAQERPLDVLINNAGVMFPPTRHETKDRFELQFGTNYLGHFALTAQLLPALRRANAPRVVNLSSGVHKMRAAIHFDDLQWRDGYSPFGAYAQSKLAMLMFTFELQRRSDAGGWGILSDAAHPGYARTDLQSSGPQLGRKGPSLLERLMNVLEPLLSQSAAAGALPTLLAATADQAVPGGYYGPTGLFELKGPVGVASVAKAARDQSIAARLWNVSEELTGAKFTQPSDTRQTEGAR